MAAEPVGAEIGTYWLSEGGCTAGTGAPSGTPRRGSVWGTFVEASDWLCKSSRVVRLKRGCGAWDGTAGAADDGDPSWALARGIQKQVSSQMQTAFSRSWELVLSCTCTTHLATAVDPRSLADTPIDNADKSSDGLAAGGDTGLLESLACRSGSVTSH